MCTNNIGSNSISKESFRHHLNAGGQDVEHFALGSVHQLVSLAILHHLQ